MAKHAKTLDTHETEHFIDPEGREMMAFIVPDEDGDIMCMIKHPGEREDGTHRTEYRAFKPDYLHAYIEGSWLAPDPEIYRLGGKHLAETA